MTNFMRNSMDILGNPRDRMEVEVPDGTPVIEKMQVGDDVYSLVKGLGEGPWWVLEMLGLDLRDDSWLL